MPRLILWLLLSLPLFGGERIIALSPSLSEIVFALGEGESIVGVSSYATYPEAVKRIEKVGGYFRPDLEKIVALRPTLVLLQPHHAELAGKLQRLGVHTMTLELQHLKSIQRSILQLGERLECSERAAVLAAEIDTALQTAPKAKKSPRTLIVFTISEEVIAGIYVAGHGLFFEEIITACGGVNAYVSDFAGQPSLNYEQIVALNPERVILLYSEVTDHRKSLSKVRAAWEALPIAAAKNGGIRILEGAHYSIPSHRVAKAITDICKEIERD